MKLLPTSRLLRLGIACAAAFGAGYLAGHGGLGGPGGGIAVVRAASREGTRPVASEVPARDLPRRGKAPGVQSPPGDAVRLPMQKSYDLSAYAGRVIYSAPYRTKRVALTFDDGPSRNTAALLRVLKEHEAKATFFFVGGRMVGTEKQVLDVVLQGSEVANHTWSHVELEGLSEAQVEEQIRSTQDQIMRTTGVANGFVRPRGGVFDGTALRVVRRMGLVMVGWDAYGHDTFNDGKTAAEIESFAVRQTRGGSIVLLHEANPSTVRALPAILTRLEREGYEFVTLAELLSRE